MGLTSSVVPPHHAPGSTFRPAASAAPHDSGGAAASGGGPAATTTASGSGGLADAASSQLRENLEALHHQLMQHAGADYDIATTTTLSYAQFLNYITQLNEICRLYQDDDGRVLVFAVKRGTDSSIFWKATVRIACVKYHTGTSTTESHRLLNIRQFLQVFRRISYECTAGSLGTPPSPTHAAGSSDHPVPPTTAASIALGEMARGSSGHGDGASGGASKPATTETEELEECVICLERRPEVILPCAHAYCLPCIQQWWEYSSEGPLPDWHCHGLMPPVPVESEQRTCPVCREAVADADDTWVISEAPDDAQVTNEISKALMGLADSSSDSSSRACSGGHLASRRPN